MDTVRAKKVFLIILWKEISFQIHQITVQLPPEGITIEYNPKHSVIKLVKMLKLIKMKIKFSEYRRNRITQNKKKDSGSNI